MHMTGVQPMLQKTNFIAHMTVYNANYTGDPWCYNLKRPAVIQCMVYDE